MPYYDYKNAETGEKTSIFMTIAEMEKRSKADMSIVLEGVRWNRGQESEIETTNMGVCAV